MTDSHRPSGEYPMSPSHDNGSRDSGARDSNAYGTGSHGSAAHGGGSYGGGAAAYPPPPSYEPERQTTEVPAGAYAWPAPQPLPAADTPKPERRVKRPLALLAAVAIAAAAVGGGTATLIGELAGGSSGSSGSSGVVSGTTVSQSSAGTVSGVAAAVSPAIVEISATSSSGEATGSGVVITADGEIVTNNHVISGASKIEVALSTGKTYTADVVGTDADKDLALIKLQGASGLKTASLGDSSSVKVGDQVVAIGSPEGLTGTVTSGIVSALDRDVTVAKDEDQSQGQGQGQQQQQGGQNWPFEFGGQQFNGDTGSSKTTYKALQTDASLNPGNSGGALINMNGEIIGINSAMYSPSSASTSGSSAAGSVGLGFAIPVNTVKADLDTLRAGNGS
ncbi:serine protease [Mesorhizobium sp. B2-3-3]|uniref:Peptidase S1 and S6 chymotrypsin/Hap n=1 Tax=Streptomyces pratensis (strain ATCC 33331 / IAF-45CD) TaxID=591167 RepID=A0A8D3WIJ9_STRFA|nr:MULTISPECIES: trypsin-like peptidase domain-containing protein [Streptomyces]MYT51702.1 trypsin-like serine protease [Streptomyces sp. SID7815]TPN15808.1 serine protease [Mesorhizobium sp. B2-3-3]WSI18350.1 trypsin-like peptidase domain-containing protein [[Kitasatospora] papulosa]